MAVRSPRSTRRRQRWIKRARAVALLGAVALGAVCAWPRPGQTELAKGNGQALRYLVTRYSQEHQGTPCTDLGTLVAAAEQAGYNVRVRNPYTGIFAAFDDPAIARPLSLHHGDVSEAGVVFYQAHPDALGRVAWEIEVASDKGQLLPVYASGEQLASRR